MCAQCDMIQQEIDENSRINHSFKAYKRKVNGAVNQ